MLLLFLWAKFTTGDFRAAMTDAMLMGWAKHRLTLVFDSVEQVRNKISGTIEGTCWEIMIGN